ncbi:hypothetical protein FNU79_01260 [Deinococcus detaillensis]|uniref:Uncharacterized protein n=1 Tax=Deinococcus detaillensis TaxID=2592048 RepID=A0A553V602_9DEIO|nr:hypothetical protein [Deinococcus detaillensis]TSA87903.1 hypothetical protein FNU79_01260 [Deinococcus detaillensis]
MKRPTERTVGDTNSLTHLPDVLGLLHADGTPLTHKSCLYWADRLTAQNAKTAQERENFMCNFEGDLQEAGQLKELACELQQGYAAQAAWRALANVFEAVKCGHPSL